MALRLNGQTTGYTELNAPDNGDSVILTMPGTDGNAGQYLQTDGSGTLSWQTVAVPDNLTIGTAVDATSQGSITYSSIPSGTKRITLLVSDLFLTANSYRPTVRIGSGGSTVSTGYSSRSNYNSVGAAINTGFEFYFWNTLSPGLSAKMSLENIDGNTWVSSHVGASYGWSTVQYGGGHITLAGTLDTVELTTTSTGTFAGGTVNVIYEAA